jgi:hypothetical protein
MLTEEIKSNHSYTYECLFLKEGRGKKKRKVKGKKKGRKEGRKKGRKEESKKGRKESKRGRDEKKRNKRKNYSQVQQISFLLCYNSFLLGNMFWVVLFICLRITVIYTRNL